MGHNTRWKTTKRLKEIGGFNYYLQVILFKDVGGRILKTVFARHYMLNGKLIMSKQQQGITCIMSKGKIIKLVSLFINYDV